MRETIEIRNDEELAEASALLSGMGYRKTSDSCHMMTFEKDCGTIVLHMNYKE